MLGLCRMIREGGCGRFAIIALAVGMFCSFGAGSAKADSMNYTIIGPLGGGSNMYTINFSLDAPVTNFGGTDYEVAGVAWAINGIAQDPTYVDFYSPAIGGGMSFGSGATFINL